MRRIQVIALTPAEWRNPIVTMKLQAAVKSLSGPAKSLYDRLHPSSCQRRVPPAESTARPQTWPRQGGQTAVPVDRGLPERDASEFRRNHFQPAEALPADRIAGGDRDRF